jgi:choline dehydrogenase-like flavoprotein
MSSQDLIGADLKSAATEPGPWGIGLTGFGECLPYSDNRITLNKELKDKYGRNTITVDASFRENENAMQKDIVATAGEMMEAAGFKNIRLDAVMSFPGNGNHEMGTARMGRDPKTSVLNGFNQMHEVSNVFITDGSFMTSGSSVNPSLTYMAMTARACDYAVKELKKQNL